MFIHAMSGPVVTGTAPCGAAATASAKRQATLVQRHDTKVKWAGRRKPGPAPAPDFVGAVFRETRQVRESASQTWTVSRLNSFWATGCGWPGTMTWGRRAMPAVAPQRVPVPVKYTVMVTPAGSIDVVKTDLPDGGFTGRRMCPQFGSLTGWHLSSGPYDRRVRPASPFRPRRAAPPRPPARQPGFNV